MNSIEMTNKSIVDDLLDKFVVDNPKELGFAIEALKSMTDTKEIHAIDESFQERIQEIKLLIKEPPTEVTSEQILEKVSAKINELSQKALKWEKEFNVKTEEVEIPLFTNDLEENQKIFKALLKLRKYELKQLKSEKEALQLYTALEGRSSFDSKERFDAFTSVSDFLKNDNERCLLLMGDAGAGKTTFCYHLAQSLWKAHEGGIKKDKPIPVLIPLVTIKDVEQGLLKEHFR